MAVSILYHGNSGQEKLFSFVGWFPIILFVSMKQHEQRTNKEKGTMFFFYKEGQLKRNTTDFCILKAQTSCGSARIRACRCGGAGFSATTIESAVSALGKKNIFNPVALTSFTPKVLGVEVMPHFKGHEISF